MCTPTLSISGLCPFVSCRRRCVVLNVIRRYAFQTEDKLYMVMDYVRGGELYQHLKKFKFFDPQRVRLFAAEILLALSYLHDMHFVYRDLKPENLLLDEEGHIRLTDFGLAKKMGRADVAKTFCGTPEYAPHRVLARCRMCTKSVFV